MRTPIGAWARLAAGMALLPFTSVQTMLPIAAWLAPIFLLRFARLARSAGLAVFAIFVAQALANAIADRGGAVDNMFVLVIGASVMVGFRALLSTLPYAADRLIGARLGEGARLMVFPAAFTTVEWLATLLATPNSTGSMLYSQFDSLALMQILSITGMWGIAWLIGWAASTVNALWERDFDWRPLRGATLAFVGALIAARLYGEARLAFAPPSGPTVAAATVTIDLATYARAIRPPFDWLTLGRASEATRAAVRPQLEATVSEMLQRSEEAMRAGAKIVGWREGAALVLDEDKASTIDKASALARRYGAALQLGLGVFTRSPAQHYFLDQSILIDVEGRVRATYQKSYPVIPGEAYVEVAGEGRLPIVETSVARLSTAICNDFHFPALVRQAGRRDVDIMLAPYDDLTPWQEQDTVVAIFRAVENGYSMIKAAGHGASMIVDYEGRVRGRLDDGEGDGVMLAVVPTHGVATIYSRIGDLFAYLSAAALAVLALMAARGPRRTRERPAAGAAGAVASAGPPS